MPQCTIAHISDLHLSALHNRANIRRTKQVLDHIMRLKVDHLVVTGDISADAREQDFRLSRSIFHGYGLLNSAKMTVVPGNHDIFGGVHTPEDALAFPRRCKKTDYTRRLREFIEHFHELFEGCAFVSNKHPFPYLKPLGELLLVGLNSVAEFSTVKNPVGSNGLVDDEQQQQLETLLSSGLFRKRWRIALIHHHFNKMPLQVNGTMQSVWTAIERQTMKLRGKKSLMKMLRKQGIDLVLHGHVHENSEYRRKRLRFLNGGGTVLGSDGSALRVNVVRFADTGILTTCSSISTPLPRTPQRSVLHEIPQTTSHVAA